MIDHLWIGVDRWRNGAITSSLSTPFFVLLGTSALLLAISLAVLTVEWTSLVRSLRAWVISDPASFDPELLAFCLPLVWLLTLKPLYRHWWRWRRYRSVSLTLDPYPGSIGGQVGGHLSIPVRWDGGMPVVVQLNCVRVSISGSGKSRSRSEKVRWRRRAAVRTAPSGPESTRIEFVVDVEDDLPSSDVEQRGSYVYWAIRVQLAGSLFDQSFEIPVFDTGRSRDSRLRPTVGERASAQREVGEIPRAVVDVCETDAGFVIDFPPGRSGAMGTILALVGFLLGAGAGFLWFQAYLELASDSTQYFALLVTTIIASGFSLFAVPLFFGGIYVRTNRLRLTLKHDWLTVDRRFFGRRFGTQISVGDIHDLDKTVTAQSGQGAAARIYYAIKLETRQARKITIADGIPGQQDADALLDFLRSRLRLHPPQPIRKAAKLPLPAWAGHAVTAAKVFSMLVVLATVAAFIADFVAMT